MLKWIQKDYLLYLNGSNEKSLWAEWDLLEILFETLDVIYPESFFSRLRDKGNPAGVEQNVYNLLEKSSADEFNHDIDILMFEGKSISTSATTNSARSTSQLQTYDPLTSKGGKAKSNNPLSFAAAAFSQAQNQFNPLNLAVAALVAPSKATYNNTFMKTVLNILCVTLTQADTKGSVLLWLERFERYVKFLMILSETWKTKHINHYNLV